METYAMVHMPRVPEGRIKEDLLHVKKTHTDFITPETSEVVQYAESKRYFCPEHGPYMADTNGEMGGCCACADIKLNLSMSRDCSYDALNNTDLLQFMLEGAPNISFNNSLDGPIGDFVDQSQLKVTKELFDYLLAYESSLQTAGEWNRKRSMELKSNCGVTVAKPTALTTSQSCNLTRMENQRPLVRVLSRDDFQVRYQDEEWLLFTESLEKSWSVPEKLNAMVDMEGRKQHLWATLSDASLCDVAS